MRARRLPIVVATVALGTLAAAAAVVVVPTMTAHRPGSAIELAAAADAAYARSVPVVRATTTTTEPLPPPTTTAAPPTTRPAPRRIPQPVGDDGGHANKPDTRPKPAPNRVPLGTPFVGKYDGPEIEGYARYDGQSICDPSAKPGTLALRDVLLARYPSTGSAGIGRSCDSDERSEHKDGRAFDWAANIDNATQRAAVDDFVTQLFATDRHGHPHALARRMGIMYVIWNRQIWGAYSADEGWRPYTGSSPHTDHVHISMSWAGARAETSFWSGSVVPGLPRPSTTTTTRRPPSTTTSTTRIDHDSTTTSTMAGGTTTTRRPRRR